MPCHNRAEPPEIRDEPNQPAAAPLSHAQIRQSLLTFFERKGLPHQDAEDLVQEVFLAWRRHEAAGLVVLYPQAYLRGIAANHLKKHWAAKARRRAHEVRVPDALLEALAGPSPARDPASQCADDEWADMVLAAFNSLRSQRCKEVIRMRYWQGLTYQETARALKISKSTAQEYERRALHRMAKYMESILE